MNDDTIPDAPTSKKKAARKAKKAAKKAPKGRKAIGKWRANTSVKKGDKVAGAKRGPKGNPPSKVVRNGDARFGARVAKARKAKGLTQAALAARLKVTQPHVCNTEKGTIAPSEALRKRIAKVLRVK